MAVWLGDAGGIRLERADSERFYAVVSPSDVNVGAKRFGFDRSVTALIAGDVVWLRRIDNNGDPSPQPLSFVAASGWDDGRQYPDGRWYVNVDGLGGVRLYRTWKQALAGRKDQAIALVTPAAAERISVNIEADGDRCLAQTVSWELNTNRETADVSSLGDGFRKQHGTMVSGSGSLDCLFDLSSHACDFNNPDGEAEVSIYLHRLVVRQEIGARFKGVFILKHSGAEPSGGVMDDAAASPELFYLCDCVVTEVAAQLEPGAAIHSRIQFVTTGPIQLLFGLPSDYLLQEDAGKELQESGFGILLETPDAYS